MVALPPVNANLLYHSHPPTLKLLGDLGQCDPQGNSECLNNALLLHERSLIFSLPLQLTLCGPRPALENSEDSATTSQSPSKLWVCSLSLGLGEPLRCWTQWNLWVTSKHRLHELALRGLGPLGIVLPLVFHRLQVAWVQGTCPFPRSWEVPG